MSKKIRSPRNKAASKAYHEEYGKLLAKEKIDEVKQAKFGRLFAFDRDRSLVKLPSSEGYTEMNRKDIIEKAMQLFDRNELVRSIINTISSAVFSNGTPDFRGTKQNLVNKAKEIVDSNSLNFTELAREGEINGDVFLWYETTRRRTEIWSLDSRVIDSKLGSGNIRNITGYSFEPEGAKETVFPVESIQHLRFNTTSTSQYGKSSLRHVFYWFDVLDSLFENNWLRGAQYYGNPYIAITGVPGPYQETVKAQIEAQIQRAGKSLILPPDTDIKVPDFSLGYPIGEIVGWVFRMITIAMEIPITLLGSADAASRGSAFFANARFDLAIAPKREVWRIGLRQFFFKIFRQLDLMTEDEMLTRKEFDIGFPPIFKKDFKDIADVIGIYRDRQMISKKSARELIGLDHSDEEEEMEKEPDEEEPESAQSSNPVKKQRDATSS